VSHATFATAILVVLLGGCSLRSLEGDRLLSENRIEEAEIAYRSFLDKNQSSRRGQQALYRLGLIYVLPDSPIYNPEQGRAILKQVAAHPAGGIYSRQASLVLTLQIEISRLQQAAQAQASLAAQLENALGQMEEEAAQASTEAGAQETRSRQLTGEIRILRSEIHQLTLSLEKREKELERIKEIDLGRMP
jgi:hypothetical protein